MEAEEEETIEDIKNKIAEKEGVPRYTQLFLASLVLNLIGEGLGTILSAQYRTRTRPHTDWVPP